MAKSEITFSPLPPPVEPTTTEVAISDTFNWNSGFYNLYAIFSSSHTNANNKRCHRLAQIGWQSYGPETNDGPVMRVYICLIRNDPAGVVLVRIDLSKLQLHMVPDTLEPSHSSQVVHAISNI